MKILQFLLTYLMPSIYIVDLLFIRQYYILLLTAFIIIPFIDQMIPEKISLPIINQVSDNLFNILKNIKIPKFKEKVLFKLLLYSWVPCAYLIYVITMYHIMNTSLSNIQFIMICISQGVINGSVGIAISHELLHKNKIIDKLLSFLLLLLNNYVHFEYTHIKIHHSYVATDDDPASAKINESIYWYLPKNILLNTYYCLRDNPWSFLYMNIYPLSLMIILYNIHQKLLVLYLLSSLTSIFIIEIGNYIQHYGLRRRKINNEYEDTNEWHSWNSFLPLYNYMLVNLPNTHSEHHMLWTKNYNDLNLYPYAPRLPFSFPTMMLIALFPSYYKSLMNPLIELYKYKRERFEKINL